MELNFVTSNDHKATEVAAILGTSVTPVKLDIEEIQSMDIEEIVTKKALAAFKELQKPVIVDDVGFYIDAWNGFPGPLVKFLLESGGTDLVLQMLEKEKNRKATITAAIAFCDGPEVHVFIGEVKGNVVTKPRGKSWGWEPIFEPEGETMTYAEMPREYKNSISMRRLALEKLRLFLKSSF